MESSKSALDRLYNSISNLENLLKEEKRETMSQEETSYKTKIDGYKSRFIEKMDDDFNTADGISVIFDMVRDINSTVNAESSKEIVDYCLKMIRELGLPLGILQKSKKVTLEEEVEKLIEERQQARKNKDWKLADKIRDELKEKGIILEDTPQGVRWSVE